METMYCLAVCLCALGMTLHCILYEVIDLRQLFGDVSPHKHSLQVDPKVLDRHPVFYDISGVGKILNPLLNLGFKRRVVSRK